MRIIIQRVEKASVSIDEKIIASINFGFLILLGIEHDDTEFDIDWLCQKICSLRIFNDSDGKMNLNIIDVAGEICVVSQFTLFASCKKGNRPSFLKSAKPEIAIPIYNLFLEKLKLAFGKKIQSGVFGADMKINLVNDGPVTIFLDSKNKE
ncbi:MAG: D-tyrosyl-tRNA(Tyr) deacylase [Chitinophagaceae bacterium]|nr:D-tyrosyl-tRNA(Tyr) deacylase [Chitinophagaceae bacterium]